MQIETKLEVVNELLEVPGNVLVSGDDQENRKAEEEVIRRLDAGDALAWCAVEVHASLNGFEHIESLGCCTFDEGTTEDDIRKFAEEHNMFREAKLALLENMAKTQKQIADTLHALALSALD